MFIKNNKLVRLGAAFLFCAMGTQVMADSADLALKSGQEYLITAHYPSHFSVIDAETDEVYKTCSVPGRFVAGMAALTVSPDGSRAYMLGDMLGTIYGIELDTCQTVFKANLALNTGERARALFSLAVSSDGKEIYTVVNPTEIHTDHYKVGNPRLQVYRASDGMDARPARAFPAPRQTTIMQIAEDGSLYMASDNIYKVDVHTGEREIAIPVRDSDRPGYGQPDVLYVWPHQQPTQNFSIIYAAPKFVDDNEDMETADFVYGVYNVDLKTGETEVKDFAPFKEVYFTAMRSPNDPNQLYAVLNRLAKFDIKEQEMLQEQELDHTYYVVTFNHAGDKLYLSGTLNDISIHDPDNLEKIGSIELPGGDMSLATMQVFIR